MQYVKPLDGLRGVSILLVMLFHYGYLPAGWIGVHGFFTLSGYLITSVLLEDRSASFGAFAGRFYWRRILRIFPAFYMFCLVTAVLYKLFGAPASFASDCDWLITYTANFARLRDRDIGPSFVHIWSLAVEQQFYLIWPLLVFFLPPRGLRWAVFALFALTPLLRLVVFRELQQLGHDDMYAARAVYVLPFTQLDAFAAGAAIAVWRLEHMRNAGRWFLILLAVTAAAGLAVIIKAQFWHDAAFITSLGYAMFLMDNYEYVWGYTLLDLLSALIIVCALQALKPARVLSNPLLVRTGVVSYGMYIYHLPLLLAGQLLISKLGIASTGWTGLGLFAVWAIAVVLVAEASFRWLERPFLALKGK